ncbi:MAG: hypothetical protein A2W91_00540 [Bacteroidetes bacterium GWF2_38_335]|nr:MAG: hypothetical protein A2W91_00540 [Bacteroidetes bacterium GWF2_38_335]OFY78320.1 MAG: hypothetical protein A2281_03920 [Bacteroidetes bacterium RIFOXYA12_FULL_38_20]HBS87484.1 collagenase-like protease [Bacteroidales bacterium]
MVELELLCPAKDADTGIAAITYGADAVYIGAGKFGARAAATNTTGEIHRLCLFAHKFNAKVYVTINTILYEDELAEAKKLIHEVYQAGADAIIIQDPGILEMNLPPVPLFASTQMHNYDPERIKFLDKQGFSRIILARELSVAEIAEIRKVTKTELEAFIHGALCVCLSGQCYFSMAISGRSANRGECMQACRMPYDLTDNDGKTLLRNKHLLSLKDLNASQNIEALINAGITSFKIEGRLKDKSYIINNTAYYRQLIDEFISRNAGYRRASSGKTIHGFDPDPEITFNRGYTNYFLEGREKTMASFNTPKSVGKFLGRVKSVDKNSILIDTPFTINNGDGLCYFDEHGELQGFYVNQVNGNQIVLSEKQPINIGAEIFRNYDRIFVRELENNSGKRKIDVRITLSEFSEGLVISGIDEDGFSKSIQYPCDKVPARDARLAEESICLQLQKSGDSIFNVTEVNIETSSPYFVQISILNMLRRELLSEIEHLRINGYIRPKPAKKKTAEVSPEKHPDYNSNISNSLSEKFYKSRGAETTEKAFEFLEKSHYHNKPLMTTRYCIKYELGVCPHKQKPTASSLVFSEPLFLQDYQRKYRLEFDCKLCLMKVFQV